MDIFLNLVVLPERKLTKMWYRQWLGPMGFVTLRLFGFFFFFLVIPGFELRASSLLRHVFYSLSHTSSLTLSLVLLFF
jgi:hypothetical protein